jgi:hypothetical protein
VRGRGEAAPPFCYICRQISTWAMTPSILLSTAYFPPVSWFAALLKSSNASIEVHETYSKQTYRNRCHILSPNGLQALTVPVAKPFGNSSKTTEVILAQESAWKRLHWKALETAYNTSPFFLFYCDQIAKVLFEEKTHLFTLNQSILLLMLDLLDMKQEVSLTTCFEKEPADCDDLRNNIHPKKQFLHRHYFPVYTQVFSTKHPFLADLSILDLLFNEGPASKDYLLEVAENIVLSD